LLAKRHLTYHSARAAPHIRGAASRPGNSTRPSKPPTRPIVRRGLQNLPIGESIESLGNLCTRHMHEMPRPPHWTSIGRLGMERPLPMAIRLVPLRTERHLDPTC